MINITILLHVLRRKNHAFGENLKLVTADAFHMD